MLSTDRAAALDVNSNVSGTTNLNAVLGRRTEAPGGSILSMFWEGTRFAPFGIT